MSAKEKIASVQQLKNFIREQTALRKAEKRLVLTVSAGTCGLARGSQKVIDSLKRLIKKEKLEKRVKVKVTGCHGFCEAEPNIIIQPGDIFYQKVGPEKAGDIHHKTVLKKKVLDELLYFDPNTGEKARGELDIPFYKKQKRIVLGDNALIDPTDINDYFSIGGYGALLKP
jgi:NADH-quinone oxidoreductase subunit F